jgi:hypothetical protein
MRELYPYYMVAWASACVIGLVIFIKHRESFAIAQPAYRRFLFQPWKLITFLISGTGMVVVAPYTGDMTWDYLDSSVMSVLCFFTAPWSVGVLYKAARRELPLKQAYVAICVWLFTASWFYDAWLLVRDGEFPFTMWWPNLLASSGLYVMGGLFWNLDWKPRRGTVFAFMEEDWPSPSSGPVFQKTLWLGLVFMAVVGGMVLWFLINP